jgi:hypothetical protein
LPSAVGVDARLVFSDSFLLAAAAAALVFFMLLLKVHQKWIKDFHVALILYNVSVSNA